MVLVSYTSKPGTHSVSGPLSESIKDHATIGIMGTILQYKSLLYLLIFVNSKDNEKGTEIQMDSVP